MLMIDTLGDGSIVTTKFDVDKMFQNACIISNACIGNNQNAYIGCGAYVTIA